MGVQLLMKIEFDPNKQNATLVERGLDFARALEVFEGVRSRLKTCGLLMKKIDSLPQDGWINDW